MSWLRPVCHALLLAHSGLAQPTKYRESMNYLVAGSTCPSTFVHKVVEARRTGEPTETWGNGQQTRPFLYIEDALEKMFAVRTIEDYWGPVNIAADEIVTVKQCAQ